MSLTRVVAGSTLTPTFQVIKSSCITSVSRWTGRSPVPTALAYRKREGKSLPCVPITYNLIKRGSSLLGVLGSKFFFFFRMYEVVDELK